MKGKHYSIVLITFLAITLGLFLLPSVFAQGTYQEVTQEPVSSRQEPIQSVSESAAKPAPNKVLQIQEKGENLFSMEFRNVEISDLLRVLAHDHNLNILVDGGVKGRVTASFSNISLDEALGVILESNNLTLQRRDNVLKISSHLVSKTFTLRFIEAKSLVQLSSQEEGSSPGASETGSKENSIYDLLSADGKLFLGKLPNSILVIDHPGNVRDIENYLTTIDRKMASRVFKLKYISVVDIVGEASSDSDSEGVPEPGAEDITYDP